MSEATDAVHRIDAVVQIGLQLAGTAASGRIALAKLAANLDPSWLTSPWDASVWPALERATAATPEALEFRTVEGILRDAWNARKLTQELDSLDPEPVAVRWISQVHRGVREGKPVAVKVLRPGVGAAMRQDLLLLDSLLSPLSGAFPELDPGALLTEARERVMDEFDLENEASTQRRFHRALRRSGGGWAGVVVPEPIGDLCHEQVLVSEWIDGTPLSAGAPDSSDAVAATLLRFVFGGIREGLIHADLDLDDVLILPDGRLAVLDYGASAVVPRGRADTGLALLEAFGAGDAGALGSALAGLGLIGTSYGELALSVAQDALGELGGAEPSRLDTATVAAIVPRLRAREGDLVTLLLAGRLEPADIYPARGIAQVLSLIARLGATGAWRTQISDALREGWS